MLRGALRRLAPPLQRGAGGARLCATVELAPPVRTLPPHKLGKNLFDILVELPNYGVGAVVYRTSWVEKGWEPEKFNWRITQTKDMKIVRATLPARQRLIFSDSCTCTLLAEKLAGKRVPTREGLRRIDMEGYRRSSVAVATRKVVGSSDANPKRVLHTGVGASPLGATKEIEGATGQQRWPTGPVGPADESRQG